MNYLAENGISVYRFAKDSGIPQSTIWSIIKKEDYEVRENNIRRICEGMGITMSEVMEFENEERVNLRQSEVPVVVKYRKLDKFDQYRVQEYADALIDRKETKKKGVMLQQHFYSRIVLFMIY